MQLLGENPARQRVTRHPRKERNALAQIVHRSRLGDAVLREPQRADEPRIARHRRVAVCALLVGIGLVPRDAADVSASLKRIPTSSERKM